MVYAELVSKRFTTQLDISTKANFQRCMHQFEALAEPLMTILATVSYHDTGKKTYLLTNCIDRLIQLPRGYGYFQRYPALLLTYAAGIGALAAKRFRNLAAILRETKYREPNDNKKRLAIERLNVGSVFEGARGWVPIPRAEYEQTSANEYLFQFLRPQLRHYLPDDIEYEETFDMINRFIDT